jgi:hypothetical protein
MAVVVGDGGSIIRSELGTFDIFTLFFELLVARYYCVWAIVKHTCGEPCPIMHPPRPWNDERGGGGVSVVLASLSSHAFDVFTMVKTKKMTLILH